MTQKTLLLLGTKKGAFILESANGRRSWSLRGPFCEAWPINHVIADPPSGSIYAGGGNEWFGPAVWKSGDLGKTWTHSSAGIAYGEGEEPIKAVWSLAPANGRLYAGVQPAGLFSSNDGGATWAHVCGLRDHPSRQHWMPGAGGLILHSLVPHPEDTNRLWVAISAAGVFYTADGGKTFEPRNRGTRADFMPEDMRYPEFGQCVHCLVAAPGAPLRLYQQNHCGMYRSDDDGLSWQSIEEGLPSTFGFPAAAHPRDRDTPLSHAAERRHGGALSARRQGSGVAQPRRRRHLAGDAHRAAAARRLFRRASPGHGDRPAGPCGRLFRHHGRRALWQRR